MKTYQSAFCRRPSYLNEDDAKAYDLGVRLREQGRPCPQWASPAQDGWMDKDALVDDTRWRVIQHQKDIFMMNARLLWAAILAGDAAERAAWEAFLCDRPFSWLEQRP